MDFDKLAKQCSKSLILFSAGDTPGSSQAEQGYRSFAISVKGASHKETEPCQDSSAYFESQDLTVAIVADGHGSPQYFRSEIGSKIAVEVAMQSIKEFASTLEEIKLSLKKENDISNSDIFEKKNYGLTFRDYGDEAKDNGKDKVKNQFDTLAKNIIGTWHEKVATHILENPISEDTHLPEIEERYRERYLNDQTGEYGSHAYGTTLIAIATTPDYWFGLHIGDGRCEVLFDNGKWEQPIPWDDKCFLNSTTSICDDDASMRARVWFGPTTHADKIRPVALFINSDGVDDSYAVDETTRQYQLAELYNYITASIVKDGLDATLPELEELARHFATTGSRDDVSIAGIVDVKRTQKTLISSNLCNNK